MVMLTKERADPRKGAESQAHSSVVLSLTSSGWRAAEKQASNRDRANSRQ